MYMKKDTSKYLIKVLKGKIFYIKTHKTLIVTPSAKLMRKKNSTYKDSKLNPLKT